MCKCILESWHESHIYLSYLQTLLLDDHLKELRRCIRPGASRHNWSTLGVFDFIAKCNNSIGKFESLVHQIQKNANDIKDRLTAMEATNLFREPEKKFDQLPSCKVSLCINFMLLSSEA